MAHLTKYSMGSVRAILEHDTRTANHSYKNPDIDRSKTHLNYSFVDSTLTAQERLEKRLSEVKVQKRKDVNVLASWIVTLPTNYKLEEERLFFTTVNEFLTEKYGKDNIISSDVHLDETTPHLHFTFVPVVKNTRKYKDPNKKPKFAEKVCADELLTREHLQHFHEELDNYLAKHQLTQTSTHRTHVNVSISDLKAKTKEGIAKELELVKTQKNAILSDAEKKAEEILSSAEEDAKNIKKQALEAQKKADNEYNEAIKLSGTLTAKFMDLRDIKPQEYPWYSRREAETKGVFNKTRFVTVPEEEYNELYDGFLKRYTVDDVEKRVHIYLQEASGLASSYYVKQIKDLQSENQDLKSKLSSNKYLEQLEEENKQLKQENTELKSKFEVVKSIVLDMWVYVSEYAKSQLEKIGIRKNRSYHR